jgi:hypothetical protein
MKRVYVCGSFRFISEIGELEKKLKRVNIEYRMAKKMSPSGILGCLKNIDESDVVYVVNPRGYVGRSVCVDVGYAYTRSKPIYVTHAIEDPPVMGLTHGVLSFEELISFLERENRRHRDWPRISKRG